MAPADGIKSSRCRRPKEGHVLAETPENVIELFDARTMAAMALRELAAKLALPDYPVPKPQPNVEVQAGDPSETGPIRLEDLPANVIPFRRKPPAA
jgi:hypothetical protein